MQVSLRKFSHILWHTLAMTAQPFSTITNPQDISRQSLDLANSHYENFPVASVLLPKHLREPIGLIYSFARQADDFADEGELTIEARLKLLHGFREELDLLRAYIKPQTAFFETLGAMIKARQLPLEPFYDLLDAFSQDVTKTRYMNFAEVLNYCSRSANPIGRLLLHLYGKSTTENVVYSDHICSALQIINFLQDIAIDFEKNDGKQRIYMCQDELAAFGISEQQIKNQLADEKWQRFMQFNWQRAANMLHAGKPLGTILPGRIGFEMRMIIAGGERIVHKIKRVNGDIFQHRPTLNTWDWFIMGIKALFRI
jgi:squalene synthase HpnC